MKIDRVENMNDVIYLFHFISFFVLLTDMDFNSITSGNFTISFFYLFIFFTESQSICIVLTLKVLIERLIWGLNVCALESK